MRRNLHLYAQQFHRLPQRLRHTHKRNRRHAPGGIRNLPQGAQRDDEHRIVLQPHTARRLQPRGRQGAYPAAQPLPPRLYRSGKNRKAGHTAGLHPENQERGSGAQAVNGFCARHVHVLLLHARHGVRRHGLPKEKKTSAGECSPTAGAKPASGCT